MTPADSFTIRRAEVTDRPALARLAALDSHPLPHGDLLVAEIGGEIVAAQPVAGGRAVADPFRRTAELVALLRLRAAQVGEDELASRRHAGRADLAAAA